MTAPGHLKTFVFVRTKAALRSNADIKLTSLPAYNSKLRSDAHKFI